MYTIGVTAPDWEQKGGENVFDTLISLIVSIVAGVTCHYICKWLDGYFRQ
ncbi:MAG: hypothetical protein HXL96_08355 [[Eubacterium] sulci]|nr:hypothetical protein [[Eubacterium] sulci]